MTAVTPFFSADLAVVGLRRAVFFGPIARSTLSAKFFAPAAADRTLRFTVRFASPTTFLASASAILAARFTVDLVARAFRSALVAAFFTARRVSAAAPSTVFATEAPVRRALSLADSTASPILDHSPFFALIFNPPPN